MQKPSSKFFRKLIKQLKNTEIMLTTSNNKNVKRVSENKSYAVIVTIVLIGMIAFAIWGDLS